MTSAVTYVGKLRTEAKHLRSGTAIEIDAPQTTRVELEHRPFARHSESTAAYRAAMASEQGWPYILGCYAEMMASHA